METLVPSEDGKKLLLHGVNIAVVSLSDVNGPAGQGSIKYFLSGTGIFLNQIVRDSA